MRTLLFLIMIADALAATVAGDEPDPALLARIEQAWTAQTHAISTASIKFRMLRGGSFPGLGGYSPEAFDKAVEPFFNRERSPDALDSWLQALFARRFDQMPRARFLFDGSRIRDESNGDTQIIRDQIHVTADSANRQITLQDKMSSHRAVLRLNAFVYRPNVTLLKIVERAEDSPIAPGLATLWTSTPAGDRDECHVDRATGDVYRSRYSRIRGGQARLVFQTLQGDFRELSNGARCPFRILEIKYDNQSTPVSFRAIVVEAFDVNTDIPAEEFVVPTEAGTLIYDYRGKKTSESGRSFRPEAYEPDAVAYVDRVRAEIETRLKPVAAAKNNNAVFRSILIANVVLIAGIAAVLILRRRRRSRIARGAIRHDDPSAH